MKTKFSKNQAVYWDSYTKDIETVDLKNELVAEKLEFKFFLELLGKIEGKTILDLGCGTGKLGLKLAEKARSVVGIDISKHSVEVANKTAKKYKINNFKGVVGDFKDQQYKDCFDYVLAVNLIHHTDNLDEILKHIKFSLKDTGKLVIFEMNPLNLLFIPFLTMIGQIKSHLTFEYLRSNVFSLKKILSKSGYRQDKQLRWGWLPTALYNKSLLFKTLNEWLNKLPLLNQFTAFNILIYSKKKLK